MRHTVRLHGVVIGYSELEHVDPALRRAWGEFRPAFALFCLHPDAMRQLSVVLLVAAIASRGAAQSISEVAAYNALALTPIGALPPIMTPAIGGDVLRSAQLALRYGYLSGSGGRR